MSVSHRPVISLTKVKVRCIERFERVKQGLLGVALIGVVQLGSQEEIFTTNAGALNAYVQRRISEYDATTPHRMIFTLTDFSFVPAFQIQDLSCSDYDSSAYAYAVAVSICL